MKKIYIVFLFLALGTQAQITIFNADFSNSLGNNAFTGSGWSIGSNVTVYPFNTNGNYLFVTPSGTTYPNNANTYAISPTINLTNYERLTLSLRFYYNTQSGVDGFRILFSTDNGTTYLPLGKENDQATNWYNTTNVSAFGTNVRGWSGNPHLLNWVSASIDLPSQAFDNKNNIRFRIEFRSNANTNYNGVAIDDFIITGYNLTTKTYPTYSAFNKLEVWYKPDSFSGLTNDTPIDTWPNATGINTSWTNATGSGSTRPLYKNNTTSNVNFNPVVNFDGTKSMFTRQGFYNHDIYIVVNPGTPVSSAYAAQDVLMGDDFSEISPTQDITGLSINNTSSRYGAGVPNIAAYNQGAQTNYGIAITSSTITYDRPVIFNARLNAAGNGMNLYLDGVDLGVALNPTLMKEVNIATFKQIFNSRFWIGRSEFFGPSFNGDVLEIMLFSERKTDSDRKKIESYLAIKYGINPGLFPVPAISLPHVPGELVDSDGVVLWNNTVSNGFTYNIGAIGRDDSTGLNQKQSKSIDPESFLTIGLRDIYTTNALNTNTFANDKDYLIWGSNLLPMTEMVSPIVVNLGNSLTTSVKVTNRTWKVTERATTDVGLVKISLPTSSVSSLSTLSGNSDYALILADDINFTTNVETVFFKTVGANFETTYNFNGTKFMKLGIAQEIIASSHIQFDGTNDYIKSNDIPNINSSFSITAWINCQGANSLNNDKTIVAKKGASQTGYHFLINDSNRLVMRFHNGTTSSEIISNTILSTNQWRNVSFTIDEANMGRLYIDGVLDNESSMNALIDITNVFTIGGRYINESSIVDFFRGKIDEVRLWNTALTVNEIRFIMNQEIEQGSSNTVKGKELPAVLSKNDINSRNWSTSIFAYFNMNTFLGTCVNEVTGKKYRASLYNNQYSIETQSAPLPYVSLNHGDWETAAAWNNGSELYYPGSSVTVNGVTTTIDWNIIKTSHNITSVSNKTLLGVIVDNNTLKIDNDSKLEVSHFLKINGKIDLEGKSQLIQTTNSDLDPSSLGTLERDQQGTGNFYNYNFWSSPVSSVSSTTVNNTGFTVAAVLKDGTNPLSPQPITWISGLNGSSNPLRLARYWLYKFTNLSPEYANWQQINENSVLQTGQAFTMKGSGNGGSQNYVFNGKPNNGTINHAGLYIGISNLNLIGNPYPSAIDANEFINNNLTAITGTLYFWEHYTTNNTHNLAGYQGGYATRTLVGGVAPVSPPLISGMGSSSRIPGRYIPVAQGFFVKGSLLGGQIIFQNSQRAFVKENNANSNVMFRNQTSLNNINNNNDEDFSIDKHSKIRIGFKGSNNLHRQLLLGFMNEKADENYNTGYDGEIIDIQTNDIYFQLSNHKLIIQGVGFFDQNSIYPLTVKSSQNGTINFMLDGLENFDLNQPIFIHDTNDNSYNDIRFNNYSVNIPAGDLTNRFSLRFSSGTLSNNDFENNQNIVFFNSENKLLEIINSKNKEIKEVILFSILGQKINDWKINSSENRIKLPVKNTETGVYIVKMKTNDGNYLSEKIIIK